MLRDYVGRLFGFDAEILGLREKVRELSWDDAYHMYTRPAFLQFAQIMPRGRRILAFIDLDYIHRLDQELGYTEVDRRVQSTFSVSFRRSDIVARWYSGDEIVILFDSERDGAERKMEELAVAGRAEGLTFKFAIGDWDVGKEGRRGEGHRRVVPPGRVTEGGYQFRFLLQPVMIPSPQGRS